MMQLCQSYRMVTLRATTGKYTVCSYTVTVPEDTFAAMSWPSSSRSAFNVKGQIDPAGGLGSGYVFTCASDWPLAPQYER